MTQKLPCYTNCPQGGCANCFGFDRQRKLTSAEAKRQIEVLKRRAEEIRQKQQPVEPSGGLGESAW